jgi:uncharacterized protein YndB with AHSA1/START domain
VTAHELVARATILIEASPSHVWRVLLEPNTILQMVPVTEVLEPWRLGEAFRWKFDMNGHASVVEGTVRRLEEGRLLQYDFIDPHSRDLRGRDNLLQVTLELAPEGQKTRVSVTQTGNESEAARLHAEGGWRLALNNLARVASE